MLVKYKLNQKIMLLIWMLPLKTMLVKYKSKPIEYKSTADIL